MRLMRNKRTDFSKERHALKSMMGVNSFQGYYFDGEMIKGVSNQIEHSMCGPDGWFPEARQWDPEYQDGDQTCRMMA